MPTITIDTVKVGREYLLAGPNAEEDKIKKWTFSVRDVTAGDELKSSADAVAAGLYHRNGASDPDGVLLCKGLTFAKLIIKTWDRKDAEGKELPINDSTVGTLPRDVLRRIGWMCLNALPDDEEIEAGKN